MVLSSLETQRSLIQTEVYYKCLYSAWKETTRKPSKVATANHFLSSLYVILLSVYVILLLVFCKSLFLHLCSFQPPCSYILWNKWNEKNSCFIFCLLNNSSMLIPKWKFQNKFRNEALEIILNTFSKLL